MIFLTVGTLFPFDRLLQTVDELVGQGRIGAEIFAQIGQGGYCPQHFESVATLDKNKFDECFEKAEAIISHAGMGTIIMALQLNKPILVVPRLKKFHEAVNDHQFATAKRFEQLGHVLAAYHANEFQNKINSLQAFHPTPRENQAEKVSERIGAFLNQCSH